MKKAYLLLVLLLFPIVIYAEDISGEWILKTELIQIIENGQIMGFANPKKEASISNIKIENTSISFTYGKTTYKASFSQKDRYLILSLSNKKTPIIITIIPLKNGNYKFSYCMDATREPASATGTQLFINYIGTMIPAQKLNQ
ncbi:hypothetical protein WKV44_05905 [Spirochaetia bacterium 38H-sp]|uniref:DUF4468 domain-containing protein n=1 Tax=Rarispira pelagica TaxID=3141764 RepID=A0ABU9UBM8_9SPIR